MYSKEQIIERISKISRERSNLDDLFVSLQKNVKSYDSPNNAKSASEMRENFSTLTEEISIKVIERKKDIESLKYRCQKLTKENIDVEAQKRKLESLNEYFSDMSVNLSFQRKRGEEIIAEKQKWEITQTPGSSIEQNEQDSLLYAIREGRGALQNANSASSNLEHQYGLLQKSKQKMAEVLQNINLASNITLMIRTRTREDNRLIFWLTIGLVVEIFLCIVVIRPYFRGE